MLWFNFILGFNFDFPLFNTHYRTLPYTKTKENENGQRIKLNHNSYINWLTFTKLFFSLKSRCPRHQCSLFFDACLRLMRTLHHAAFSCSLSWRLWWRIGQKGGKGVHLHYMYILYGKWHLSDTSMSRSKTKRTLHPYHLLSLATCRILQNIFKTVIPGVAAFPSLWGHHLSRLV